MSYIYVEVKIICQQITHTSCTRGIKKFCHKYSILRQLALLIRVIPLEGKMALRSARTLTILSKAEQDNRKISSRFISRSVLFLFVRAITAAATTTATTAARYTVARVRFAVRRGTTATTFTTTFAALAAGGARRARTAGLLLPHFLPDVILLYFLNLFLTERQHSKALIRCIKFIQHA